MGCVFSKLNSDYICKACGCNQAQHTFMASEMVCGTKDEFAYKICKNCATIQLVDTDVDMSKYYDNALYSSFKIRSVGRFKSFLIKLRNKHSYAGEGGFVAFVLSKIFPLDIAHSCIGRYAQNKSVRFLDVGCGKGKLLNDLAHAGFLNLDGLDPYIENEIHTGEVNVYRKQLDEVEQQYDIIRLHHSFEHMQDPVATLSKIKSLLLPKGVCILTIPVNGFVFERYREHSFVIQAPQHYCIYSIKGMEELSSRASFKLVAMYRDTLGIANWLKMSAIWGKNVASNEINGDINSYFSNSELNDFDAQETRLASSCLGDNVTFVLRHE